MSSINVKYSINLTFEEVKLPPFEDILVLGKHSSQGKMGIFKSVEFLVPNGFELVEINSDKVEAVFISKRILAKVPKESVLKVLSEKVFPYITDGEILKVDFKVAVSHFNIDQD
jgi:hypothetical protein